MRSDDIKSEISKLNVVEKLILVEDLWDDIAASNEVVPLYEWQKTELDTRLEAYGKGELAKFDWQLVHAKLRNKYK
ncbi:MAG: addiction module protein [Proteobacteria bacterium]|nr:addiction module protein [Pseudomonadota bacterium]